MTTQLQFSRHARAPRQRFVDGSDNSSPSAWKASPRHVAFAVHDAVPSPQLYLQYQHSRPPRDTLAFNNDINVTDSKEIPIYPSHNREIVARTTVPPPPPRVEPLLSKTAASGMFNRPTTRSTTLKSSRIRAAPSKPSRKPGWEVDGRTSSNLFDANLKKNSLFQSRAGDRQREVRGEGELVRGSMPTNRGRVSSTSLWNARVAAALPSQPKRKQKDYVKMNMEKITGQRYETLARRKKAAPTSRKRDMVFERLSAPVVNKSLLRFRSPSPTRATTSQLSRRRNNDERIPHSPTKLKIASPVSASSLTHESARSPPRQRAPVPSLSSLPRGRASTPRNSRYSGSSRASSPGFRSERSRSGHDQPTIAERVFEVLDRQGRGRIGVEQVLDGLRLLQLPATHNQVADYVYLIHEGTLDTINFEEWSILVGTLDAASSTAPSPTQPPSVRSRSSRTPTRQPSPIPSRYCFRGSPLRSFNQLQSPSIPEPYVSADQDMSSFSERMHRSDLSKIAAHADDIAELLLDDLLLDTVEMLNKQERHLTNIAHDQLQVGVLDTILLQIDQIERAESQLIANGMALGYEIDGLEKISVVPPVNDFSVDMTLALAREETHEAGNLMLPLGVIMSMEDEAYRIEAKRKDQPLPSVWNRKVTETDNIDHLQDSEAFAAPIDRASISMAVLGGRLFQSIETNRARFLKHRELVESSLESTGMDQASVIEMLADLLLDEIAVECALELESGVEALTETLAQTLL